MSDTPRTDKEHELYARDFYLDQFVHVEFTRTLERENDSLRERLAAATKPVSDEEVATEISWLRGTLLEEKDNDLLAETASLLERLAREKAAAESRLADLERERAKGMEGGARRFVMYRRAVPTDTHDENQRNAPDQVQFEGIQFSDGRVAVRWLTAKRSVSVWDSLDDMLAIHGHPEYGSELVWIDAARKAP